MLTSIPIHQLMKHSLKRLIVHTSLRRYWRHWDTNEDESTSYLKYNRFKIFKLYPSTCSPTIINSDWLTRSLDDSAPVSAVYLYSKYVFTCCGMDLVHALGCYNLCPVTTGTSWISCRHVNSLTVYQSCVHTCMDTFKTRHACICIHCCRK